MSPKSSQRPSKPPGHAKRLKLEDHYSPLIAKALKKAFSGIPSAVKAALDTSGVAKAPSPDDKVIAQSAVRTNVSVDTKALTDVFTTLYGDSYIASAHDAAAAISSVAQLAPGMADAAAGIDWSTWQPGDVDAANLVAQGGLRDLLGQANVTIQSIADNKLDDLGNVLAQGLANGDSVSSISASMVDLLDNPNMADTIARTEVARAMTQGSIDTYDQNGITQVNLVTADPCDECEELESDNPYDIDDAPDVPVHPNCRCALSPVVDLTAGAGDQTPDDTGGSIDDSGDVDMAVTADDLYMLFPDLTKDWTDAWENEERDSDGRFVSGGGGSADAVERIGAKADEGRKRPDGSYKTSLRSTLLKGRAEGARAAASDIRGGATPEDLRYSAAAERATSEALKAGRPAGKDSHPGTYHEGRSDAYHAAAEHLADSTGGQKENTSSKPVSVPKPSSGSIKLPYTPGALPKSGDAKVAIDRAERAIKTGEVEPDKLGKILKQFDAGKVAIHIRPGAMLAVLRDGRFKSQFESKGSGGTYSPSTRLSVEEKQMGVPRDLPKSQRPIYGALLAAPKSASAADAYGSVRVLLKDDVKNRSTMTGGDSFGGQISRAIGETDPVRNVAAARFGTYRSTDATEIQASTYAETQIHGGVSVSDIEKVLVPAGRSALIDSLTSSLKRAGIPYETHTGSRSYGW